jgi:uncharacterized protein YjbI with pentapeptide repeats
MSPLMPLITGRRSALSIERGAALTAAYEHNLAEGQAPYAGVKVQTGGELQWIMEQRAWSGQPKARGQKRADFRSANLAQADFNDASLYEANLDEAEAAGAHFCRATMPWSSLRHIHLAGADLRRVILYGSRCEGADLRGANFEGADLRDVDLTGADVRGATFRGANLLRAITTGMLTEHADFLDAQGYPQG